jgi:hypothetical protein
MTILLFFFALIGLSIMNLFILAFMQLVRTGILTSMLILTTLSVLFGYYLHNLLV